MTTGEGTGKNCPTEKLFEFRKVLKEFPFIVGAGVTAGNVCEKLEYVDGVIIGSWLKEGHNDYGDVCEEYVKEFMDKVVECRAILSYGAVQLFEKGIGISYAISGKERSIRLEHCKLSTIPKKSAQNQARMKADLGIQTLKNALTAYPALEGAIIHSDRGIDTVYQGVLPEYDEQFVNGINSR